MNVVVLVFLNISLFYFVVLCMVFGEGVCLVGIKEFNLVVCSESKVVMFLSLGFDI